MSDCMSVASASVQCCVSRVCLFVKQRLSWQAIRSGVLVDMKCDTACLRMQNHTCRPALMLANLPHRSARAVTETARPVGEQLQEHIQTVWWYALTTAAVHQEGQQCIPFRLRGCLFQYQRALSISSSLYVKEPDIVAG